jgi:tetratricopeptide (TPR) repeat protein
MIKNICLIVILVSCGLFGYSQNQYADSLRSVLKTTTDPVDRFDLLNNILLDITSYRGSNIDSLTTMQMVQVAQKQNNDSLSAISYNWLASYFYQQKGDNATALEYYFKAIPLAETTNDKRRISSIYFDMALVYFVMLDYEMALKVEKTYLKKPTQCIISC